MKTSFGVIFSILILLVGMMSVPLAYAATDRAPSFDGFHKAALQGERLTVAFFGASLTWGANASDHARTSYRARIAKKLESTYPNARFTFIDGAIGGTGSNLGVFRLQRDCLAYKPDLVFLDFSANDDIGKDNEEKRSTYESLVRRILSEGNALVVSAIFPFQWNSKPGTADSMKGRIAHLEITKAYNVPVGDAITHIQAMVKADPSVAKKIWEFDAIHPGDYGYQVFADAVWGGFRRGIEEKMVCTVPETLVSNDTYMHWSRNRIADFGVLPKGWVAGKPSLTSAWYDAYMPRWLDSVVIASNIKMVKRKKEEQVVEPLTVSFKASSVMLYGEETTKSGKYQVFIDGEPVPVKPGRKETVFNLDASKFGGNRHHNAMVATGLDPAVVHTLEIRPQFEKGKKQELRLESICLAGGEARIVSP